MNVAKQLLSMEAKREVVNWIQSAKRMGAVIRVLRKPMTKAQIFGEARKFHAGLHYTDVPKILQRFVGLRLKCTSNLRVKVHH
ncbi:MAG: hypothetical protein ACPGN3_14080, partial [Opitutales bacterium]